MVESPNKEQKIYINVCRDITKGTSLTDPANLCPLGSAGCLVVGEKVAYSLGGPSSELQIDEHDR